MTEEAMHLNRAQTQLSLYKKLIQPLEVLLLSVGPHSQLSFLCNESTCFLYLALSSTIMRMNGQRNLT